MKIISGLHNKNEHTIEVSFTIGSRFFNFSILPHETRKPLEGKGFIPEFYFIIPPKVEIIYSDLEQGGWYTYLSENEIIWFDYCFTGIIIPKANRDYLPEIIEQNNSNFLKNLKYFE
jgi:hypothetical protein